MDNKKTYKKAAIKVLSDSKSPLHYREIAQRALDSRLIHSEGLTPWATMSACLSTNAIGDQADFVRTEPGFYQLNPKKHTAIRPDNLFSKNSISDLTIKAININPTLTSKQKGDIGEARIAELITLYSLHGLSCYRPISDDEGIDIVVKMREDYNSLYLQVKTTYGNGGGRGFVSTVKESRIPNNHKFFLIFAYFDTSRGDLFDHVFCIPAPDFLKLTESDRRSDNGHRVFTVGLAGFDKSKYADYVVEKRELANKLQEYLNKHN